MKRIIILIVTALICENVCEESHGFFSNVKCFRRCENNEVVCYIGENGFSGSPSCFKKSKEQMEIESQQRRLADIGNDNKQKELKYENINR